MITMKRKINGLSHKITFTHILLFLVFAAMIPLIISIFHSGYSYVFDADELYHAQLIYLYAHGVRPYLDIYNSMYAPLFGWFFLPLFILHGFSFATIYIARYVMIIVFAIRVILSFFLVKKVFGRRVALLFTPMFLLDPFVIFSSMQIRPDNLMMTVFTAGMLVWAFAITHPTLKHWFLAGLLFAVALLVLPKILPSLAVVALLSLLYWIVKRKHWKFMGAGLAGFFVPVGFFCLYTAVNGSFAEMIRQTIIESRAAYSYFSVFIPLGNFYIPNNVYVYGAIGKPLTWYYAWLLPLIACAGMYAVASDALRRRMFDATTAIKLSLAGSLILQWTSLYFLSVVFMQHYIPISWLYALFGAVVIDSILTLLPSRVLLLSAQSLLCLACLMLIHTSYNANMTRSTIDSTDIIAQVNKRWAQIPEGSYSFPNLLFRPSIHPITYEYFFGNVPPVILDRLPSVTERMEKYHVNKLLVDDYLMGKLPIDIQSYIMQNYQRVPGDSELWLRK